jgi:hypothetical protein
MKTNKLRAGVLVTALLISFGVSTYNVGKKAGEKEILDRWENRWFDSEWYDYRSIEDILYDTEWDNFVDFD